MAIKLTIDEGNSSTKAALWRGDTIEAEVMCAPGNYDKIAEFVGLYSPIDVAIFCSVCRSNTDEVKSLLERYARRVIILDSNTPLPITLGYRTPSTLGADRIAAAVGAATVYPGHTCLVVDMGTAITYDVVSADGKFIGGNIAPGIFVRLEALEHYTKALPLVETDGDCPQWGYNTETAMRSGAIRGVVGELQYYRQCLSSDTTPKVLLTGGSADLITPYITFPITIEQNLVRIGLNSIINHNENK